MGSTTVLHVLHGINAAYKSQDLLHQPGLEHACTGMSDQRNQNTRPTATQAIVKYIITRQTKSMKHL